MAPPDLDDLLAEGREVDVEAAWGAGFLAGRFVPGRTSWTWAEVVEPGLRGARSLLDLGTGEGGELTSLAPLPPLTVATEGWLATVPAAIRTLRPAEVQLVVCASAPDNLDPPGPNIGLPFAGASFGTVLSRHESFDPAEVRRVCRPGGRFITQQVGTAESAGARALLGLAPEPGDWDLRTTAAQVEGAGWVVEASGEERPLNRLTDVAALVGYVRSTPWQFEEVLADPDAFHADGPLGPTLRTVDERCHREGGVTFPGHRFWLRARLPG
jgi:SAM-dependent methyltransferase